MDGGGWRWEHGLVIPISNLFEHEEEDCQKPVKVGNFWINNYIEYESKGDRNKILSVEEYLNETKLYLKYIINNFKEFDTQKIHLITAINFFLYKDNNVMGVLFIQKVITQKS